MGNMHTRRVVQLISRVGVGTGTGQIHSEMEQPCERKEHPLLNDVILKILFEFISGEDLVECRLVCKKWCELTLSSARSKFNVNINGYGPEYTNDVTEFVEVFRHNKLGIPFDTYNLDPFCTTEGPGQEFLQICGSTAKIVDLGQREIHDDISEFLKTMPNIEFFKISHCNHSRCGNVVRLIPDESSSKPALRFLKELVVCEVTDDANNPSQCCPMLIEEILSIAPNVSRLKVRDYNSNTSRIGQVLNAIEKFKRESVITHLHFIRGKSEKTEHFESLKRLAENGMKLKSLDFIIYSEGQYKDSIKIFSQLATLFKNSIERLAVDEVCSSFIQLPYMPKLETLKFFVREGFDSKSVNLKKLFPALKKLELWHFPLMSDDDDWEWEEFLPNTEPCPNVKTLSLRCIIFNMQVFDHILLIFPNLTKLVITVETDGVQILRKILTQMTQLEELCLYCGAIEGNIDALLTGIPVQKVKELEHVVTELKEMTVQLRAEVIRHYRNRYSHSPSITNLTNLKRLHLISIVGRRDNPEDEGEPFSKMTDVLLYFGLYSMKHINELKVQYCEFTKAGCEILTAEMGLTKWYFKNSDFVDIIPSVE